MTALDQALIKACTNQNAGPGAAVLASTRPAVPLSQAMAHLASKSAKVPVGSLLNEMLGPATVTTSVAPDGGAAIAPPTTSGVDVSLRAAAVTDDRSGLSLSGNAPHQDQAPPVAPPPPAPSATIVQPHEPSTAPWRPMLQVDHCLWPNLWDRLHEAAQGPMDQLTTGLATIVRGGRKVLGFGSCSSGEGVTTMLWAAGRRLAAEGFHIVLVDANLANPQLVQTLGLLPQVGWEDTLEGRLPLEEVVIESVADGLALLPVRDPMANPSKVAREEPQITAGLDILAEHYEAVLIDLGPLTNQKTANDLFDRGLLRRMDAIVLIHDVRTTTPDRLARLQQSLAAADIVQAGTIQNFVAR